MTISLPISLRFTVVAANSVTTGLLCWTTTWILDLLWILLETNVGLKCLLFKKAPTFETTKASRTTRIQIISRRYRGVPATDKLQLISPLTGSGVLNKSLLYLSQAADQRGDKQLSNSTNTYTYTTLPPQNPPFLRPNSVTTVSTERSFEVCDPPIKFSDLSASENQPVDNLVIPQQLRYIIPTVIPDGMFRDNINVCLLSCSPC